MTAPVPAVPDLARPIDSYRTTPAPEVGEDAAVDALASAVCQTGGHIPNRDRRLPGSCEFHRRMAYAYVRTVDEARASAEVSP